MEILTGSNPAQGTQYDNKGADMHMNKLESEGYNAIMGEVRLTDEPEDPWGSNIAWLFALADYMWAINGEIMPGYRPSPMGVDLKDCSYELETLFEINDTFEDVDVRRVYAILNRRDDILRVLGKNY
ncbi:MAG TPA: hypothetical protein VIY48_00960 [Candidatus Paceibacterota bacterium]